MRVNPQGTEATGCLLWVTYRLAEEAAVTAGVPQKAAEFRVTPRSAALGHNRTNGTIVTALSPYSGKHFGKDGRLGE